MKRFYAVAITALREANKTELADDIDQYVAYVELKCAVLVHELSRPEAFAGKQLLKSMGYDV